jgi:GcrA cell cycle regulator
MSSTTQPRNQQPVAAHRNQATTDWSDADEKVLRKMWRAGESARSISLALDGRFTRNAVISKVRRFGLHRNPTGPRVNLETQEKPAPERRARFHPSPPIAAAQTAAIAKHEEPNDGVGLSLDQLTNETCRWPKGTPGEVGFVFCGCTGADFRNSRPYCAPHDRRALKHVRFK